jgi:Peptidase family M28
MALHGSCRTFGLALGILLGLPLALGQAGAAAQDPQEPADSAEIPRLSAEISCHNVNRESLRTTVEELVACGTRSSLSSWDDPKRGVGCGRDHLKARLEKIAAASGGRLQVVDDVFQATAPRTNNQPVHMENLLGILPGSDPQLKKVAFVVSGHYDSMPSNVMDAQSDAPGADDDASGTAVSMECARLLAGGTYRATLVFAAVSGEEQGLLGGTRLLEDLRQQGYEIGGMLDNDIVGADFAPGAPHRVRLFSGAGTVEDADSPSRELARAIEEIDGRDAVRLIFRVDRLGRGGDHYPFYKAGLPGVRFTEPLENYHHEHQTPRVENGVEYGDLVKFLNFDFMSAVARDNAEALRQLALAPAAPEEVWISGGVTPNTHLTWTAPDDRERAGFEVLWRETTEPRWSVFSLVTEGNEGVLKGVSTDNHFFAVRAVGKNGARSIAVPAAIKPR